MPKRGWGLILVLVQAGCVHYRPRPLDPPALERQYRARTLPDGPLDMGTAMRAAQANHPGLLLGQARLRSAEAAEATARARVNPSLSFGAGYSNSPESALTRAFEPVFLIETAGKRGFRSLQAQRNTEAARLEVAGTAWQIRSRARDAWLERYFGAGLAASLRSERDLRAAYVAMLERRLEVGETGRPEVDMARAGLLQLEVALRAAESREAETAPALAAAIGVPAAAVESRTMPGLPPPAAVPPVAGVQRAGLLHRIDVRRSLAEYAATEAALQLEVARQYPDIGFAPGYTFDEGHYKFSFGPSLTLPLFNRNRGSIGEAQARRAEAEARFIALQAQAIGELETALARYQAAMAEWREAGARLIAFERDREAGMERAVAAGEQDRLSLTGLRIERAIAARAELEALQKAHKARAALEDAMQQELP